MVRVRKDATEQRKRGMQRTARGARVWAVAAVVAGALLGGCRTPQPEAPEMEAAPPAAGDQVAFVRDMMIEKAKMSKGPARTEKAVEAVREWGGKEDSED